MYHLKNSINTVVEACHGEAKKARWWENRDLQDPQTVATCLCLIHSEISEAMEGHRKGISDDKLPHRSMIEVELADALIRICDLAGALKLDLGGALDEKMAFNRNRSDHKPEVRAAEGGKAY